MNTYNRGDAGRRAATEIRRTVQELDIQLKDELESLDLTATMLWNWGHGKMDPGCKALHALWLGGYDVMWILTGVREV